MKIQLLGCSSGFLLLCTWSCFLADGGCPNQNVSFWLYSNATRNNPKQINPMQIDPADFLPAQPVVILIHGYAGNRDYAPNAGIRPTLLHHEAIHVISVDYSPLAKKPCFRHATLNSPLVSQCLAQLINNLVYSKAVDNNHLHLIGFSMGAHVAGQTANYVNEKLHQITGLDPSKPLFVAAHDTNRLDAEDANFVDIIHTNPGERGILKPMGHADFYVNFREGEQPGCEYAGNPGGCSHLRAPQLYAESIRTNQGFWGIKCENWSLDAGRCTLRQTRALMGYYASPMKRGVYFLETYPKYPFAAGHKGAVITNRAKQLFEKIGAQHIDVLERNLERKYLDKERNAVQKAHAQ